jgi:hypothetical protein
MFVSPAATCCLGANKEFGKHRVVIMLAAVLTERLACRHAESMSTGT